ncbi:MAG TPA: polysaccharide deacetylase family protein [Dongiaceae bacterium]
MSTGLASDWDALARECDAWASAGRRIALWWRDDDAVADTPALRRLIHIARVPLALAVIPAALDSSLPALLLGHGSISVLQHGFAHQNRAPSGGKKSEFPASRPWAEVAADLARGRDRLAGAFGDRFVPVLTPPWNRIDASHAARLPELSFRGLTAYLARTGNEGPRRSDARFTRVNTHVDVMDWRGTRGFVGLPAATALLAGHLRAKRQGKADAGEPTGLLTHHLVHDTETWEFLGDLQDWCAKRPNVEWQSAADLFPE